MLNTEVLIDDGQYVEDVGKWAEKKYRHIGYYAKMFSTGMKNKWECLVYIDLFAGAGLARIKNTQRIVAASPMLALNVDNKFNRYIFCEIDDTKINALKSRIKKYFNELDTHFIEGDVNTKVDEIVGLIPRASKKFRVLGFCVVDPYNMGCLNFSTIEKLAKYFIDFFVLIPSMMDANRNEKVYTELTNNHIECFIGDECWRENWCRKKNQSTNFGSFILMSFGKKMQSLGYQPTVENDFLCVRNPYNNSPLYHLGLFSRSDQGKKFWNTTKKYSEPQLKLPFES